MKRLLGGILIFISLLAGCTGASYINSKDQIDDKEESIIKEYYSHHGYSNSELKKLEIKYIGTVDEYKIYYVPSKYYIDNKSGDAMVKDGQAFPVKSFITIVGIKSNELFTLPALIQHTQINAEQLFDLLPQELIGASLIRYQIC